MTMKTKMTMMNRALQEPHQDKMLLTAAIAVLASRYNRKSITYFNERC
jgi:hypothetical protein